MEVRTISIRAMREAKSMTQAALAEAIGVKQAAVAQWELGKTGPTYARLSKGAEVLECKVDDLIKDDE